VNEWLRQYGWRFLLWITIAVIAFLFIVHLERKADGLALVQPLLRSVAAQLVAV
jgi:type II secretory pathway component PulF